MIYKIDKFIDDDGRQVFEKSAVGEIKETLFSGIFTVAIPTSYGPQEAQIEFDFPEKYELKKCFEEFDKLAEEEYERLLKEVKEKSAEKQILTPNNMMGGIIMP